VPLFFVIERADSLRRAVFYGWLMGLAAHLYWLSLADLHNQRVRRLPVRVSVVVFVLYAALQGIQMALLRCSCVASVSAR
jgi:hypothetical protein